MVSSEAIRARLTTPVDAASAVWFRVAFGLAIVWEMGRFLTYGWVERYLIDPVVLFPYWPFTFIGHWPQPWMAYAHVLVIGAAALAVAVGWRYRIASVVLFVGFTWLFLFDQTRYLNHFYLIVLLSFVLMWLPLNREGSVDARTGVVPRSATVPLWTLLWLQFMVGVPYFFGGVAKIGSDWLSGFPMRDWLSEMHLPVVGPLLHTEASVMFFVWGGLLFDLLIVPMLLWRRTRTLGLGLMLVFHLLNSRLFKIGIFPWMMIGLTLVFLPPDWPRRLWDDVRALRPPAVALLVGAALGAAVGEWLPSQPSLVNVLVAAVGVGVFFWSALHPWDAARPAVEAPAYAAPVAPAGPVAPVGRLGFGAGMAFVVVQLLLPFRHLLIPGNVHWTEEGHKYSWHMKLRDKSVQDLVYVVDPPGAHNQYEVDPKDVLSRHQYAKVASSPEMTVLLGQWLAEREGTPGTEVYAKGKIRLNGRRGQPLVDPKVDLTKVEIPWWPPAPWIVPLKEDLPPVRPPEPSRPRAEPAPRRDGPPVEELHVDERFPVVEEP